jgi:hypothetical protein
MLFKNLKNNMEEFVKVCNIPNRKVWNIEAEQVKSVESIALTEINNGSGQGPYSCCKSNQANTLT